MEHIVLCPHCKKTLTGLPYLENKDGIAMFFCPHCSMFLSAAFMRTPVTPQTGKA